MSFPIAPSNGQIATVNGIRYIYSSTVGSWTRISNAKFTAAASAPSNPALGDEWYNTNLDILLQYVNDGTTSYWIDIQSLGQTGNITQIGSSTLEGNIVVGVTNRYSIGAANGYVANVFVNNLTANAITVSGNIVPSANVTYDLGSSNFRFRDLWLSGNTIYFGGASLASDGSNVTISGGGIKISDASGKLLNSSGRPILQHTGSILQRQYVYHTSTSQLTSSGAFHELTTSLRIAFTPVSTTSTLFLTCYGSFVSPQSNDLQYAAFYDVTNAAYVNLPPLSGSKRQVHWFNRTTSFDVNDAAFMYFTVPVANSSTTARTYTVYHSTEGSVIQFLTSTLATASGATYPLYFEVVEVAG